MDIFLNQKKERKFLKKIEIFNENFGMPKILQTDIGKEFDNQYIKKTLLHRE